MEGLIFGILRYDLNLATLNFGPFYFFKVLPKIHVMRYILIFNHFNYTIAQAHCGNMIIIWPVEDE